MRWVSPALGRGELAAASQGRRCVADCGPEPFFLEMNPTLRRPMRAFLAQNPKRTLQVSPKICISGHKARLFFGHLVMQPFFFIYIVGSIVIFCFSLAPMLAWRILASLPLPLCLISRERWVLLFGRRPGISHDLPLPHYASIAQLDSLSTQIEATLELGEASAIRPNARPAESYSSIAGRSPQSKALAKALRGPLPPGRLVTHLWQEFFLAVGRGRTAARHSASVSIRRYCPLRE